ncbi:MAG: phospholipid/cholesterol/gamma-HCH transport system substrate-binding protein [Solirubrobacteraceae bacterium]|jgi:phospholipid/cholesterol/gamma-HCH transport system substrate-binding protein|nr:phospholipid/cholesterol/gamma-HCH transport system substrate-binding protein [Solirubrobacteraceae bacterium]
MARRVAALGALLLAVALVVVLLKGGGSGYKVKLITRNASQLVPGDLVQVAGTSVGKVGDIKLTENGEAVITVTVSDDYAPLREGTRAVVRQASLSGIANRYIDLQQGAMDAKAIPNGATLPAETTESAIDLDQLFNTFDPKTRKAAQAVIGGFADATQGNTEEANAATKYFNPVLSASSRLFGELDRNDDLLERFIVKSAQLVTDVDAKREDLAGIVQNFGTVSTALASQDTALADAINRLPGFLRKSNTTFVNLRATLDDLDPLVDASKPVVRDLRPLLADLRPFARNARPTFRDLARTIRRPGKANDLVELLRAQPAVARATTQRVRANGKLRPSTFKSLSSSLTKSAPEMAFFRPYAEDLTGWFDDFSTSGAYDANGAFSRAGLALSAFTFTPALNLIPLPLELRKDALAAGAKIGRNNRCPGSDERDFGRGEVPFRPTSDFNCDPTMTPVGP